MPQSNSHYTTSSPVTHPFCVPCYADTGASGTYLMHNPSFPSDSAPPLHATCPNGNSIFSNKKIDLAIPLVPPSANEARVFDDLTNNLLAIGQLCNHDCEATFTKNDMTVTNADGQTVLTGSRNFQNGLWVVNVPINSSQLSTTHSHDTSPQHFANGIIRAKTTATDLVDFHHRSLGSPSISTLTQAIQNGFLSSFPGLTTELVRRHLPKSTATAKGHLHQTRQGIQSTHASSAHDVPTVPNTTTLSLPEGPERTNVILAAIEAVPDQGKTYGDLTGRYPVQSATGNNYQLVIYHYDANAILVEPLKSRNKGDILHAYRKLHTRLTLNGLKPKLQTLDNEASDILLHYMAINKIDVQLAPPHMHRRNLAERAIRTWKDHFIAFRATCDPKFPSNLWDLLIPQAELTLNLLRPSRIQPKLSAYCLLNGHFDYNRTPIAPPGTKVIIHEKPKQRGTWDDHGVDGWYIGPAPRHYRCFTCYVTSTRTPRVSDTVEFFPVDFTMPRTSSRDQALQCLRDLLHVLRSPSPASPFPSFGVEHTTALTELANIFSTNDAICPPSDTVTPSPTPTTAPPSCTRTPTEPSAPSPLPAAATQPPSPPVIAPPPQSPTYPTSESDSTTRVSVPPTRVSRPITRVPQPTTRVSSPPLQISRPTPRVPQSHTPSKIHPVSISATTPTPLLSTAVPPIPLTPSQSHPSPSVPLVSDDEDSDSEDVSLPPPPAARPRTRLVTHSIPRKYHIYALTALLHSEMQHVAQVNSVLDPTTGVSLEYEDLLKNPSTRSIWETSAANEFGRLAKGVGTRMPSGTNTIRFIRRSDVPKDRKPTYAKFVCTIRPQKKETHRTRLTVGGNLITFTGDVSTPTADITLAKLLINSTLSTPNAKWMGIDLKDFYLNNPMASFEYMRIPLRLIPEEIVTQYNLQSLVAPDGFVYIEIRKGMYGLPQAGRIAHEALRTHLEPFGYYPIPHTQGLWTHRTRNIFFCLVVDDFGIKYINKDDANHLLQALEHKYECSVDWDGTTFCGIKLNWNYFNRTCDLSIPGYVMHALKKFNHTTPTKPCYSPHPWNPPKYGTRIQFAPSPTSSPPLNATDQRFVQQVVGTFLFYARCVDPTLLPALNSLAEEQAAPTTDTLQRVHQFLDYVATFPDSTIRYRASAMQLWIDSDAAYLVSAKARSRVAGVFYLSDSVLDTKAPQATPSRNGPLLVECKLLRFVQSSSAEAEIGGLFHNGVTACPILVALDALQHPQQPVPIKTDNTTAAKFANRDIKHRLTKHMDMRYYWIVDRSDQGQFIVYWAPGCENLADYFSKHHHPIIHRRARPLYLHGGVSPSQRTSVRT